jgi:O-antigen ligase
MSDTSAWETPSRRVSIAATVALLLTVLGEGAAIRFGSTSLALVTLVWYGCAFLALAWYRLPLALLGLVVALPLITVEIGFGDVEKTASADKVALSAVVLVWLVRRLPTAWCLGRLPSVRWWGAFLVVVVLSALSNGLTLGQGWGLVKQALYAAVFLMALDIAGNTHAFRRPLLQAAALAGLAVAILTVLEAVGNRLGHPLLLYFKHDTMQDTPVPGGTISHVNFLGGYLLLVLPVLVAVSATAGGRARTFGLGGAAVVALTFLYVGSMGAAMGLLAEALLAVGLAGGGMFPRAAWHLSLCGLVLALVIAAGVVIPKSLGQSVSLSTRLATYQIGMAAAAERPLLGFGANGYPSQFPRLEQKIFGQERDELHQPGVPLSAHSSFLDVAVERGLLGLAAFVGLLASLLSVGIKAYFRQEDLGTRMLLLGLVAGMTGFIVQAFTENLFSYSKVAAIFWILAAALVSLAREGEVGTG